MYLLVKFGGHRSYRNRGSNHYINFYLNILEKAELTPSVLHIVRFLKSGIPIYNPKRNWLADKREGEEEHRQLQKGSTSNVIIRKTLQNIF